MGFPGRIEQLRLAADAAEARAVECRERLVGLRGASALDEEDVQRAKERLAAATSRAQAAERRLAEVRSRHADREPRRDPVDVDFCELPERLSDDDGASFGGRLLVSVREGHCNGNDLWLDFASYGGRCDFWEFDAYLNGLWAMPAPERRVLAQIWWEWERGAGS